MFLSKPLDCLSVFLHTEIASKTLQLVVQQSFTESSRAFALVAFVPSTMFLVFTVPRATSFFVSKYKNVLFFFVVGFQ